MDGLPNIVLTGFMGTGKSTVGRVLASRLGYGFVDTDRLIEARHGAIAEIFAERGESGFRSIEHDVAVELATHRRLVIATGGRMLLDPANAEPLAGSGRVFCLTAEVDTIVARIVRSSTATERPMLAGGDPRQRIVELLAQRQAGYAAFEQVATDARNPDEIAAEIVTRLGADA